MTSAVNSFVSRVEHQAWERIEKCAIENPNASRFFSIAVAGERVARALFQAPAVCIEQIISTGKSFVDYLSTSDQEQKKVHLDACKTHAFAILTFAFISIPVGLIGNIMAAGVDFVRMIRNPLSVAKREIAMLDLAAYKENAPEHGMFAQAAFERFSKLLSLCKNNEELTAMHFMDTEDAKAQLITEFNRKKEVLDKGLEVYNAQEKNADVDAQWQKFQENLVNL